MASQHANAAGHVHAVHADHDLEHEGHHAEDLEHAGDAGFTSAGQVPPVEDGIASPAPASPSERAYGSSNMPAQSWFGHVQVSARSSLRVRSAPSLRAPIIDRLRNGEMVQTISRAGAWVQIVHGNGIAYVHGDYLRSAASYEEAQTPARASTPPPQHASTAAPQYAATTSHQTAARHPSSASERAFTAANLESYVVPTDSPVLAAQQETMYRGVRIIAPAGVHMRSIERTKQILDLELGRNAYAQRGLAASRTALVIIPPNRAQSDMPQLAGLRGGETFDHRDWSHVRGSGGLQGADGANYVGVGEEDLFDTKSIVHNTATGHIMQHEMAHAIHAHGMTADQQARVAQLFAQRAAMDRNHDRREFSDYYAGSNAQEYFAQSTSAFFGTNAGHFIAGRDRSGMKGNGRDWLRANDPGMYQLLVEIYETQHA